MAGKGNSRHMKGLASTRYLAVHKKEKRYVTKPGAGRHTLDMSVPIVLFVEKAGVADSTTSAVKLLRAKLVKVNGAVVTNPKYPVGLNDVVSTGDSKTPYVAGINERGQVSISDNKGGMSRTCKVVQKYKARKGVVMMRLHDGTVLKAADGVRVNDSVVVGQGNRIERVLALGDGKRCMVIDGVHVGASGTIKEIKEGTIKAPPSVLVDSGKGTFETLLKNIMMVE